jgi:hypothetical protein
LEHTLHPKTTYHVWGVKDGVAVDFSFGTDGRDVDLVHLHDRLDVKVMGRKDGSKGRHDAGIVFELGDRPIGFFLVVGPQMGGFLSRNACCG